MSKRIIKVVSVVLALIGLVYGYYFFNKKFGIGIPCVFYEITGYKCPGCGMTRSLFSLVKGNFREAFTYNKSLIFVLPYLIVYFGYKSYLYILDKKANKKISMIFNVIACLIIVLLIGYGIVRNI